MSINTEVLVVSAFGRGNTLAAELAQAGISCSLLDLSEQLGVWTPEDWEGPFGFFRSEDSAVPSLSSLRQQRFNEDDELIELPQGFTVWDSTGPIELRGSTQGYRLSNLDVKKWIEAFSFFFAQNQGLEPWSEGRKLAVGTPLSDRFFVRQATRRGRAKALDWCRTKGVQVLDKAKFLDVSFLSAREIQAIEVQDERPEILKASQFVWCLSAAETEMVSSRLAKRIEANRLTEPEWSWVRYRYQLSSSLERDVLPTHFVVVQDWELPWRHSNVMIVQRTASLDLYDVWVLIPTEQRFNKQYLISLSPKIESGLSRKLPQTTLMLKDLPQEYHYSFSQLGPARFVMWSEKQKRMSPFKEMMNLHFLNPEKGLRQSLEGSFSVEEKTLIDLKSWWQKKEDLRIKKEEREREKEKLRQSRGGR
jgi:hypothetical protein